jgi:hypothetical protein
MKETELRIGNYLMDEDNDSLVVVSRIENPEYTKWNTGDDFSIVVLEYGTKERYLEGDFKPIPLNQEWLRNLGFNIGGYDLLFWEHPNLKNTDFAGINWADEDIPEYQFLNVSINGIIIQIDYVHQLQNLYFLLTGEELTLKKEN